MNTHLSFTPAELRKLRRLKDPHGIQRYLDALPYHLADTAWSPRRVLREGTAHCLEGAIFGAAALREQKASGVGRRIVGFEMIDRGIARHGYDAYVNGAKAGTVTSGTQTPFLKKAIGMAYLPVEHIASDTEFDVDIRGRRTRARVVPLPFYKRQK